MSHESPSEPHPKNLNPDAAKVVPRQQDEDDPLDKVFEGIPLDEEKKETVIQRLELLQGQFSSPVPPPFIMREHGEVLSSAPERIFAMAERQAAHRQSLEQRVTKGADIRAYIGQGCALTVALVFGYFSYDLIRGGAEVAGAVLGTVDLVGLVSVFLVGRRRQSVEAQRRPLPPSQVEQEEQE
ncbi:DUF2335 domain-containing protein [Arthrobacter sp. FX8]|uniref:DUF2335 domain-containing protein n=1 Tax=Arthrobacter sp. FX8 TaxID=2997335 RepID=UPI00227BFC49|nr:DUF2335 domain-containing protein [Arthrobacter sp. FX8]WAJ33816.1 DUF2335 domain-containing protein [Arthrobacter sp. FX8]